MNTRLLERLASPVFDEEEAWRTMRDAGVEIVRLEKRIDELTQYNHQLKDQVERLALDLGLKEHIKLGNTQ